MHALFQNFDIHIRWSALPAPVHTQMFQHKHTRYEFLPGGTIVDLPELASILVSDRVYRTYKFLCAMARGIPIVGQPYLEEVQRRRELVDPWDFILEDAEMERRFKFSLKKSLQLASEAKIFQDYSMFVTPSTKPPPDELQRKNCVLFGGVGAHLIDCLFIIRSDYGERRRAGHQVPRPAAQACGQAVCGFARGRQAAVAQDAGDVPVDHDHQHRRVHAVRDAALQTLSQLSIDLRVLLVMLPAKLFCFTPQLQFQDCRVPRLTRFQDKSDISDYF